MKPIAWWTGVEDDEEDYMSERIRQAHEKAASSTPKHFPIALYTADQLRTAIEDEEQNPWKRAIIDALVIHWAFCEEHNTNPRKALNDLLCISNQVALDPQVSSDAAALIKAAQVAVLWKAADNISKGMALNKVREMIRRMADELENDK